MQQRSNRDYKPRALTAAIALALAASGAQAATFNITSNADAGPGTLRQAIIDANGQAGPHVLDFSDISGETITLAANLPGITEDMTLQGSEITLSGDDSHGCLDADGVRLAAEQMTITRCSAYGGGGIYVDAGELDLSEVTITDNDAAYGGGIVAFDSSVTIADSTISDNTAYYEAGGIYSDESALTITDSTISGNTAAFAGGLTAYARQEATSISGSTISGNQADYAAGGEIVSYSGNIAIRSTTISGNTAAYEVGGLFIDIYQAAEPVVLDGVTITGNQAGDDIGGLAASVYANTEPGGFEIRNSIIAGNTDSSGAADLSGAQAGINYTLVGAFDQQSNFTLDATTQNLIGADPMLGPLADNGGFTLTHLPGASGAGLNIIPVGTSGCGGDFGIDQRGQPRPGANSSECDLGSVERDGPPPPDEIFADRFEVE